MLVLFLCYWKQKIKNTKGKTQTSKNETEIKPSIIKCGFFCTFTKRNRQERQKGKKVDQGPSHPSVDLISHSWSSFLLGIKC